MRLALVLLMFTMGCVSLATYNLFLRPVEKGNELQADATAGDWIQLAVFGKPGTAGRSSGGSSQLYRWTDASGAVRFTEDANEIPPGAQKELVR